MKRLFSYAVILMVSAASLFAASYKNNTYQKLAEEYTAKAVRAMDAGEYVLAEEYAALASENAALSEAFIKHMMERSEAEKNIALARNRLSYVQSIHGDVNFPIAFEAAKGYLEQAQEAFGAEEYELASSCAQQVLGALAEVYEITPLPKYYIVRPWAETKDCFWNISGRSYVYNNPFLWENLYEANKASLPEPDNPNLILPGMKMEIPSITGEYRDGVYSPTAKYETYSVNR